MTPHPEKDVHPYLLLAQWTPRGHGLVMVQDYDIYYITSPKSNTGYRVTDTAIPGILSNGLPDWLYEGTQQRTGVKFSICNYLYPLINLLSIHY